MKHMYSPCVVFVAPVACQCNGSEISVGGYLGPVLTARRVLVKLPPDDCRRELDTAYWCGLGGGSLENMTRLPASVLLSRSSGLCSLAPVLFCSSRRGRVSGEQLRRRREPGFGGSACIWLPLPVSLGKCPGGRYKPTLARWNPTGLRLILPSPLRMEPTRTSESCTRLQLLCYAPPALLVTLLLCAAGTRGMPCGGCRGGGARR